jgi:circadian clock protein KaiB
MALLATVQGVHMRPDAASQSEPWVFRLYVAGVSPNSTRAIANLYDICRKYIDGKFEVEIIDILADPLRPIRDGVLATPTVIKVSPPPEIQLWGTLDDRDKVLMSLGIRPR